MDILNESFRRCLPPEVFRALRALGSDRLKNVEEVRLRNGRRAKYYDGRGEKALAPPECIPVDGRMLEESLTLATGSSFHSSRESIAAGYVTLTGGHRIGVCGSAVVKEGQVWSVREISSLAFRVAKEIKGCGDGVLPMLFGHGGFVSTLIISPPGCGKTTLTRDLVRRLSDMGLRIGVVDERGELAAMKSGRPSFDLGECTDVLDACPKADGMLMLTRSMAPSIIAVDEITSPEDVESVVKLAGCGVGVIATAHAAEAEELKRRPVYRAMLETGVFGRLVRIRVERGERRYSAEELS